MNLININSPYLLQHKININNLSNISFCSIHTKDNYDTISFSKNIKESFKMSLYSKCTNNNYVPKEKEEELFAEAMSNFSKIKDDDDKQKIQSVSQKFFEAYENIAIKLQDDSKDNSDTMKYVFCSLIDCLDNSESKKVSSDIDYYLFYDFLPTFGEYNTIKDTTKKIIASDLLKRNVIKISLKKYCS